MIQRVGIYNWVAGFIIVKLEVAYIISKEDKKTNVMLKANNLINNIRPGLPAGQK